MVSSVNLCHFIMVYDGWPSNIKRSPFTASKKYYIINPMVNAKMFLLNYTFLKSSFTPNTQISYIQTKIIMMHKKLPSFEIISFV